MAHSMAAGLKFRCKHPQTFACPSQRRFRITSRHWINKPFPAPSGVSHLARSLSFDLRLCVSLASWELRHFRPFTPPPVPQDPHGWFPETSQSLLLPSEYLLAPILLPLRQPTAAVGAHQAPIQVIQIVEQGRLHLAYYQNSQ